MGTCSSNSGIESKNLRTLANTLQFQKYLLSYKKMIDGNGICHCCIQTKKACNFAMKCSYDIDHSLLTDCNAFKIWCGIVMPGHHIIEFFNLLMRIKTFDDQNNRKKAYEYIMMASQNCCFRNHQFEIILQHTKVFPLDDALHTVIKWHPDNNKHVEIIHEMKSHELTSNFRNEIQFMLNYEMQVKRLIDLISQQDNGYTIFNSTSKTKTPPLLTVLKESFSYRIINMFLSQIPSVDLDIFHFEYNAWICIDVNYLRFRNYDYRTSRILGLGRKKIEFIRDEKKKLLQSMFVAELASLISSYDEKIPFDKSHFWLHEIF
jgi:hypothetical protein